MSNNKSHLLNFLFQVYAYIKCVPVFKNISKQADMFYNI